MKRIIKNLSVTLLLAFSTAMAGQWHPVFENRGSSMSVNSIASRSYLFDLQIAVGDNGNVYRSWDAGRYWEYLNAGTAERLNDVVLFFDGSNDVVIAVGDNGTIVRSYDNGTSWQMLDSGIAEQLTKVVFDESNQEVWVAGRNSTMYYSADYGNSWNVVTLNNSGLNISDMVWDYDGLFIAGDKNDSTFVHRILDYQIEFAVGDTIPNATLSELLYYSSQLFIGGTDILGDSYIYVRFNSNGLSPANLVNVFPQTKITDMDVYYVSEPLPIEIIWLTTATGEILESRDGGGAFNVVYKDPLGRSINAVLTDKSGAPELGQGVAVGFDELFLKYSFELLNIIPNRNDNLSYPTSRLELEFTSTPFIPSVNQNIKITSNFSGNIPFWTEYNTIDSHYVFVNISRALPPESIPGEKWNITVGDSIRQLKDDGLPNSFNSFNYDVNFMPYSQGSMSFEVSAIQNLFQKPTTNFVTGFFNNDDILDLATFDGDTLYVLEINESGTIGNFRSLAMFVGGMVDPSLKDQLVLADLNNDGRQDIIFYDSNFITTFINQSVDAAYDFYTGSTYNSINIKQVQLFNGNNNANPDMIILNDSLLTRMDISETNFGYGGYILEFGGAINQRMKLADLDVDGWVDLITSNSDGSISYYHGQAGGYFDTPTSFTDGASYRDIFITDFDDDKRLEILALKDQEFDLYTVDFGDSRNLVLHQASPILQVNPQYIEDVVVHDFGGALSQNFSTAQIDIALVTIDSTLKLFENLTYQNGNISFFEREDKQQKLGITSNGLIQWDGNADANLDLLVFDRYTGDIQNIINKNYSPVIINAFPEAGGVRINWARFDEGQGGFDYYRLHRESWEHGIQDIRSYDFFNIDDTTFLDREVRPLEHYSYWFEVGFNGQSVTNPVRFDVDLVTPINGPVSGSLTDSTAGYVVDREISVPSGQSLFIGPGVEIGFAPGATFNVFGSLTVQGSVDQMIELRPFGRDSTFGPWNGVRVHPGADTVIFDWASIAGADTAIVARNRPLDMRKGGINRSLYGIVSIGDTLTLENILVDSNMVGISIENSKATIKNVNAISNEQHGINVIQNGSANIRNSIIWNNGLQGVNVALNSACKISYSTVDIVSGLFSGFELNRLLPPIFLGVESDSDFFYQPDPLSPTIDAGDPDDDFSMEPMPNGGRINQGLLGNLILATPSNRPHLVVNPQQIISTAKIGEIDTVNFSLSNTGVLDLAISSIDILGQKDIFSISDQAVTLLTPGQTTSFNLLFKPDTRQQYNDTLVVMSNDPAKPVYKTAIVAVGENTLPELVSEPSPTAEVGQEYRFQIQTRDQDNDNVSIVWNQIPSWINQDAVDDLRGTPTVADIGTDTLSFELMDSFGGVSSYLFPIIVFQDNIIPQFEPLADTTIFTNVPFNFQWKVTDLDGDILKYSDNTSLFDIHPDSGTISFTPQITDTGKTQITLSVTDGIYTVQDSFTLEIQLNLLNGVQNLVLTARDQAIDVAFSMPQNDLYSGTRILLTNSGAIVNPNQNAMKLDTVLAAGADVQFRIIGLQINTTYHIGIYNYFQSQGIIYSQPITGSVITLAPAVELSETSTIIDLPVNQIDDRRILVRNTGGGTLIARFTYTPDSLLDVWFDMDTTQHSIAPFDSLYVDYRLHPNKYLPRNRSFTAMTSLESNDPADQMRNYSIHMNPIFDDFNPNIIITARPDSIVRQSAFTVHFYGDDTTGYPIGDPQDSLYYHYRLFKGLNNPQMIERGDSVKTNALTFFPLDDGFYTLRLWATDSEGNEKNVLDRKNIQFYISATSKNILRNRWQMVSIPRPVQVAWGNYMTDSLIQIYRWDNKDEQYLPLHSFLDQEYNIGQAVWVISKNNFPINLSQKQADIDSNYSTPLEAGWNQIGAPFTYVTGWGNMTFIKADGDTMTLAQAAAKDLVSPVVYWYQFNLQDYGWEDIADAVALPWRGYWLKSEVAGTLGFSNVAVDTFKNAVNSPSTLPKAGSDLNFNISLTTDENGDRNNVFGIASGKRLKDVQEPPQIGSYSMLYFQDDNKKLTRQIADGFMSAEDIKIWQAVVESRNANKKHTLSWDNTKMQYSGLYFSLVDVKKEIIIDMNKESSYTFKPAEGKRNFKIYASQDASYKPEIIPVTYRLVQNFPNPFNPVTTIRFGVPQNRQDQKIRLTIYNVLGQEIVQLFNKSFEAGYHEIKWNGQNSYGQDVSSGVYFYKLESGKNTLARKMILLR